MRLLQIANVGQIVGGTAACAWTITRALPHFEHHVRFLSPLTAETERAFQGRAKFQPRITSAEIHRLEPDVVLLHNIAANSLPLLEIPMIQYVHSHGPRNQAHLTLYCSQWLRDKFRAHASERNGASRRCLEQKREPFPAVNLVPFATDEHDLQAILYQAVTQPPRPLGGETRALRNQLRVGRICTPTTAKWPAELPEFYRELAREHPQIDWDFVGCPSAMEAPLSLACGGRARFFPPGFAARSRLWQWDALLYHHPHLTESFGRTAADSLRCGCIPIVDHRGGFLEQLTAASGFLCQSPGDFSDALGQIASPVRRRQLSRSALAHGNQAFGLARFATDLISRFRQVMLTPCLEERG